EIEDLAWDRWNGVIGSIVHGTFLCTQQAFRIMKEQKPMGGRIINNGSISAHVPRPNSVAYTTAKHAVTGLTKSTSLDGRKYDISCGQIDVGNALTEMTQRMTRGVPQPNGEVVIEPTMDVQNVARAVAFMATVTPDANVQTIPVSDRRKSAAKRRGIARRYPASRMRKASPVSAPPVPATNSATTAPMRASPPLILRPARKYGSAVGSRRYSKTCPGEAP